MRSLAGSSVQVSFTLRNAQLYAYGVLFNVLTLPVTMIPNLIYNDSGDSMFPHGEGFGQLWCGITSLSAPSHLCFVSPGPCAGLSACFG